MQAKREYVEHGQDKYADAVSSVQTGVGDPQKLVTKDSFALQKQMKGHRVRMCHQLGSLFPECVSEAREDRTGDGGVAGGLYVESL